MRNELLCLSFETKPFTIASAGMLWLAVIELAYNTIWEMGVAFPCLFDIDALVYKFLLCWLWDNLLSE